MYRTTGRKLIKRIYIVKKIKITQNNIGAIKVDID